MKKILLFVILVINATFASGQVTIEMTAKGKVYSLPGKVNGLKLNFIFDTGASEVYLSMTEAMFMLKNGYLKQNDFTGTSHSQIGNGEIVENTTVLLREVEIGGIKIQNVKAAISHNLEAPLLLGQSAIQKLGPIQLDGNKLIIQNGKGFESDKQAISLYYKAFQYIEAEKYETAISILNESMKYAVEEKTKSLIYGEMATAYYRSNQKELAIKYCHKALGEDNMNEQAGYNLGVYLYKMGKMEQAENALLQQISKFEKIPVFDKDLRAASYSYLAEIQYNKGEYLNAETNYQKSLDLCPNPMAYLGLGDVYLQREDFSKATENYEKGIAYEPNRPSNIKRYFQLGLSCYFGKQTDKARDAFNSCIYTMRKNNELFTQALTSNNEELKIEYEQLTWFTMMSTLWLARTAKSAQECISYYNNILEIQPIKDKIEPQDYINLAGAYHTLKDTNKAQSILEKAKAIFPTDINIMFSSSLLMEDNDPRRIELLQNILKYEYQIQPQTFDYATVYNNIAWTYCCLKQYAKGLSFAEKSVQLCAEHGYSWETLGELYFFLERYEDCIKAMTKCLSCLDKRSYKSALNFRGNSLIIIGKKKEGKKDLNDASKL
ncbi:retroviral-like aspartic protease family protein [Segatella maculosa]|uniref:TIGR02281 family clan AA aspartic protease n=1 Tax=Segatella maculosa OT 289 TaxID=999422 RepID=H1HP17_9BACT|nr:retroviral-like aspartic protease family protein [Segatella maculosa]EHO68657.1 TIGR02281 family clan AA aspartic protease [Segatella maculosa OT 289]